jgi:hypothetical protein
MIEAGEPLLHDRDGAFADECNGHGVGAHAVARDAAGGVGGDDEAEAVLGGSD